MQLRVLRWFTVRVINVVNLMKLQPTSEHPHGLGDKDFDALFTTDKPIIFAFHGYPTLIHRLTYRRTNHKNLHVRGFKEEGTTTTPFDMVVLNDLDRFHLFGDVLDRLPQLGSSAAYAKQFIRDKLLEHKHYIAEHGEDLLEIRNWKWGGNSVKAKPNPGHPPSVQEKRALERWEIEGGAVPDVQSRGFAIGFDEHARQRPAQRGSTGAPQVVTMPSDSVSTPRPSSTES